MIKQDVSGFESRRIIEGAGANEIHINQEDP